MRRVLAGVAMIAASLTACQTITEEMPTRANPVLNPVQVVVVPVPIPTPNTPGPGPTDPNPVPNPGPNPAPNPAPNPGGNVPSNTNPVVKLGAKVFFLECNGAMIPGSENATETNVGCRIHYDCTPKDSTNTHTRARGTPEWSFNDLSLIKVGNTVGYTPTATAKKAGKLVAWAVVDGVRSNDVVIHIR
jgi:hypothetical protein